MKKTIALAALLALAACGKKTEQPAPPADSTTAVPIQGDTVVSPPGDSTMPRDTAHQ